MSRVLSILVLSLIASGQAYGITVSPGQPFDFSFDNLVPAELPGGIVLDVSVYWWPPFTFEGLVTIDLYEDSSDDSPFFTALIGFAAGVFGFTGDYDQWNDLEGRIVMTAIEGTYQFDSVTFGAIADNQYFARTYNVTAVPLPTALIFLLSGFLVLGRRREEAITSSRE